MQKLLGVIAILICGIGLTLLYVPKISYVAPEQSSVATVTEAPQEVQFEPQPINLLFVGDIMLGRAVETRIKEDGFSYPFQELATLLESPDLTIGNFEGVVSEKHVQAPSMTFKFSIRNEYLTYLKQIGFDVLSLANNHSYDYGHDALVHTRSICKELKIICGGSPVAVGKYSATVKKIHDTNIGFVFLHTVFGMPTVEDVTLVLDSLNASSDIQIAYIHWGDEYVTTHNTSQEIFAQKLIDSGVDTVIGHHPHVVQDIGFYKEKPIFYSLGNFVFDQYFSDDVQEGLGVEMTIDSENITYTLHGFTSKESRNQPRLMDADSEVRLFTRILESATSTETLLIENGVITTRRH